MARISRMGPHRQAVHFKSHQRLNVNDEAYTDGAIDCGFPSHSEETPIRASGRVRFILIFVSLVSFVDTN